LTSEQVKTAPQRLSPTRLGVFLLVAAIGAGGTLLAFPRAVEPRELPGLVLDPAQIARVQADDARRAAAAPGDATADALTELVAAQGLAEVGTGETPEEARERFTKLANAALGVERAHGEAGVLALRAKAVLDFEHVLATRARGEARDRVLGSFPRTVERYDVTRAGRLRAPRFVLRTLYKSRWNAVCQLAATWQLTPVELRAFHGWLALGAESAAPAQRVAALEAYAAAGGVRSREARAGLAWLAGDLRLAEELYGEALIRTESLRFRNHLRAARLAAGDALESP
jgi:hypothetical protein